MRSYFFGQAGFRPYAALLLLSSCCGFAAAGRDPVYITGTDNLGITRELDVSRTPALYTSNFGDCLGGQSLFNITKFDAAYYADNMTVLFHLDGSSNIRDESLMLVITLQAYGETHYTQTFDPCFVNMHPLCPVTAGVPINGYASFSLSSEQVSQFPSIAMTVPDFDGYVSLQIFANSSHSEIGCFQATMTNGNTISLPDIIAPTLAVFVAVAMAASFATAAYGFSVPLMRAHYAHSLSAVLVVEVLQTIFLTGALSLHWPSVLVAWWSNFAWTVGLIPTSTMLSKIGTFAGVTGNASQVGGAGSTYVNNGGGSLAGHIYGRRHRSLPLRAASHNLTANLVRRKVYNVSDPYDYSWGGNPVSPGMPLPGSYQSFGGTLSEVNVPGNSAFTLSLIWLAIAVVAFPIVLLAVKTLLELLIKLRLLREDSLPFFRLHYQRYALQIGLRMLLVVFAPLITMAVFQFTISSSTGSTVVAAVVFVLLIGALCLMFERAISFRLTARRRGDTAETKESVQEEGRAGRWFSGLSGSLFPHDRFKSAARKGKAPEQAAVALQQQGQQLVAEEREGVTAAATAEGITAAPKAEKPEVLRDDNFVKQFGWLAGRYRPDCWWFFAFYYFFQLVRACVLGGGGADNNSTNNNGRSHDSNVPPTAQVAVLVILDVLILVLYAYWRPFEGRRNMALGVWVMCSSRAVVALLCIALLPQIGLSRIGATVIGFAILIIQAVVVIFMIGLIVTSVITTWLSLSRNQDDFNSEVFYNVRQRYLQALLASATGAPQPQRLSRREKRRQRKAERQAERQAEGQAEEERQKQGPSFHVVEVRRAPKIEDFRFLESDSDEEEDGKDVFVEEAGPHSSVSKGIARSHVRGHSHATSYGRISEKSLEHIDEEGEKQEKGKGIETDNVPEETQGDTGGSANHKTNEPSHVDERAVQRTRRRRTNSGGGGGLGMPPVLVQIYDPSRVIARANRARTNSVNSQRSARSVRSTASNSQFRLSVGTEAALGGGAGADIGIFGGHMVESPVEGSNFSAAGFLVTPTPSGTPQPPLGHRSDTPMSMGRVMATTAGPVSGRMTPTRETLERHASERWSLPPPPPPPVLEDD